MKSKQSKREFFKKHKFIFVPIIVLFVAEILVQIFYPSDMMLPIAYIDGIDVGSHERQDVVNKLNEKYNNANVEIYFGENARPTFNIKPSVLGVQIGTADRVNSTSYKWYLKLIPSSILWAGLIQPSVEPNVKHDSVSVNNFVAENLGDSCNIKPVNAVPKVTDGSLKIVNMLQGGTCQISDVKNTLNDIQYSINTNKVRISMDEIDADITDDMARNLATSIGIKLQRDILMTTEDGEKFFVPGSEIMSWLDFSVIDKELVVIISKSKSEKYYAEQIAPKVTTSAGVTVITTSNLTDLIRESGSDGKVLNIDETNRRLAEFLMDKRQTVVLAFNTIFSSIEYTSQFESDGEGLEGLIKYYIETHSGDYAVWFYELGGQFRRVSYNANQRFKVAGAARMILGFTMLDRLEQGLIVAEDDALECVEKVINSFNISCVDPSVLGNLEGSVRRLGLSNTFASSGDIISSANDIGTFLQRLHDERLGLERANNQIIYNGLKNATPRNGISAVIGVNNLNATGASGDNLSDGAIVFTADTRYVLVILTSGASNQNIAELASQIQNLVGK